MMAKPNRCAFGGHGLDRDEIDANRQARYRTSVGQAILDQSADSRPQVTTLAMVEGLLRKPEVPATSPPDLDDDEVRRWARVDRHEIELVVTDMDVPGQDGPARLAQPSGDELLGGVTRQLSGRSTGSGASTVHCAMIAVDPHPAVIGRLRRPRRRLHARSRGREFQAIEVDHVERRVVGHHRDEFPLQEVVRRRGG